jgi:hypothetical protein
MTRTCGTETTDGTLMRSNSSSASMHSYAQTGDITRRARRRPGRSHTCLDFVRQHADCTEVHFINCSNVPHGVHSTILAQRQQLQDACEQGNGTETRSHFAHVGPQERNEGTFPTMNRTKRIYGFQICGARRLGCRFFVKETLQFTFDRPAFPRKRFPVPFQLLPSFPSLFIHGHSISDENTHTGYVQRPHLVLCRHAFSKQLAQQRTAVS